jgi:hypothetical protein
MTEPGWVAHAVGAARTALHLSGAGLLVALGIGSCTALSSLADHRRAEKAAAAPAVVVAQPTKEAARIPTETVQAPVQVEKLSAKQEAVLEKRYQLPAGALQRPTIRGGGNASGYAGARNPAGSAPGAPLAQPLAGASGGSDKSGVAAAPALHAFPEQKIDPAPWGATALPTLDDAGKFSLLVRNNDRPWFRLGGIRRAGVSWDPFLHTFGGFAEQDFASFRLWDRRALVIGIRPFASYGYQALPGEKAFDYGLPITVAVEF